jgi:cytoskeletal protein CcmA (bactofilin family)
MSKESSPYMSAVNSIIGPGSIIKGDLKIEGGLRVDGTIEGTVEVTDTLTVGQDGLIKGDVKVKHAIIGGSVIGVVHAEIQLELQNGSRMEGDMFTRSLVIEEGVFFEGKCQMRQEGGKKKNVENVEKNE